MRIIVRRIVILQIDKYVENKLQNKKKKNELIFKSRNIDKLLFHLPPNSIIYFPVFRLFSFFSYDWLVCLFYSVLNFFGSFNTELSHFYKSFIQFSLVKVQIFVYTQLKVKSVLFQTIQFSISTQISSIWPIDRTLLGVNYSEPEWTCEWWQWRGTAHSPNLQHYKNLIIKLYCVISRTIVGEVLRLCRDAVSVFCIPIFCMGVTWTNNLLRYKYLTP